MKQCIVCNESVPPERVLSSHENADQSTFDDVVQSFNVLPQEDEEDDCTITLNAGGKSVTATPDEYKEALATLEKRKQAASEQEASS